MALKDQLKSLIPLIAQDVKGKGSSSVLMQGNGRPDKPETTGGKITGDEPNGTFYISTRGAGVGAYLWQKQNGKWAAISADTGARMMTKHTVNIKQGYVTLRRVGNMVECAFTGGPWGAISFYGSGDPKYVRKNHAKRMDILPRQKIPQGFRSATPFMLPFYNDDGDNVGMVYVGSIADSNYIELRFKESPPTENMIAMRLPVITWITNDPFPDILP